jgi:cation transport ATPase
MPVDVASGSQVFAATLAQLGSVRVKTVRVGTETTFRRVVKMVEEAEAHRADVQRFADTFSAYYVPVVMGLAVLTFLISRNPLSTAAVLAEQLNIEYRANLLPEHKIDVVKDYQAKGHTVVMVGDGVNDAPALAQADIGIAMGAAGTDIAIEAAHIALMRDDWTLVPEVVRTARRTMGVVKMNFALTAVYNVVGLALAALGILPPVLAAAAQSFPDVGILANSAQLLRHK